MGQITADMVVLQRENSMCLHLNFKLFDEDYQTFQLYRSRIIFSVKQKEGGKSVN